MQGKCITFEPLYTTFEFGSPRGNSAMDQQTFWSTILHTSPENQNLPAETLSADRTDMFRENLPNQEIAIMDLCDSNANSSNIPLLNNENRDGFNLQIGWRSSTPPSVNGDIDLNRNHVDDGQSSLEVSNYVIHQNSGYNAGHVSMGSELLEFLDASDIVIPRPQRISSSSPSCGPGSPSRVVQLFPENGGSTQAIPNGRSLSLKRKNVELAPGPSSTGGSSSSADNCLPYHEDINVQSNSINQAITSGNDSFGSIAENEEIFQRNTRMRISHAHPSETSLPYICPQGNTIRYPNQSSAHRSVSPPIPSDPLLVSSRVANNGRPYIQFHAPNNIGLPSNVHPFTLNGAPHIRAGSAGSLTISSGRSVMGETSSRAASRNDASRHLAIAPLPNPRSLAPGTVNWGLSNGSASVSGNVIPTSQSSNNLAVYQPSGANWASSQRRRHMLEFLHIPPLSSGSEPRGDNVSLPRGNRVPTLQENVNNDTGIVPRVHQPPAMRSSHLTGRQTGGILGIPVPSSLSVTRERRRMRAELRTMFDQIRRAEIPPQDLILIDHSMFFGGADILDRHRDLRLDVDNMSYEELLALEEQIGNVSTGLTDEKIGKCLNSSKYATIVMEPSKEVEPCCICQEEYLEGEEMGRLECGHDFHAACIRQWLQIKNQCPICKKAALSS